MNLRWHILLVGLVLAAGAALAQETARPSGGFAVGPLKLDFRARAATESTLTVTVAAHETTAASRFTLELTDVHQDSPGVLSAVRLGEGARSCAPWLSVPADLTVAPNGRQDVPVKLALPADARGTYHAFLLIKHVPQTVTAPLAAVIQPVVRVAVNLTVIDRDAAITIDVTGLRLEANAEGPEARRTVVTVSNSGEVLTPLEGDVLLRGPAATVPLRVELPRSITGDALLIYPGAKVEIPCPLPAALAPGRYEADLRLRLLGDRRARTRHELTVPAGPWQTVAAKLLDEAAYVVDLDIDPSVIDLAMPRGATRSYAVRLSNLTDQELRVAVRLAVVRIESDGLMTYGDTLPEPTWLKLRQNTLTLRPRGNGTFTVQLTSPKERAERETQCAAIVVVAEPASQPKDATSKAVGEYAVLVIARDPEAAKAKVAEGALELVRPAPRANPSMAVVSCRNVGSQIGSIEGDLWLAGENGKAMVMLTVGGARKELVLPGGERRFRLPLPPLDRGSYTVEAKLRADPAQEWLVLTQAFDVATERPAALAP